MRPRRIGSGLALGAGLALSLVACSMTQEEGMTITLDEAKAAVWETEDELVALVPAEMTVETFPRAETSPVLFECAASGEYYWPGGTQVGISADADTGAIIEGIAAEWEKREGWDVGWVTRGDEGLYHLDLWRQDGLHFAVMNLTDAPRIAFNGFSPCFRLEDYDPLQSY